MGFLKGLNAYKNYQKEEEERTSRKKTDYFKLAAGESVNVRFLQELDPNAEGYSEKRGIGFIAIQHSSPTDFKKKAVCTAGDPDCIGCQQNRLDYVTRAQDDPERGKWKPRKQLYINVLVDDGKSEPYVAVLQQGLSAKSIVPTLFETAEEAGTITDTWFKVKRTGGGLSDTSYSLIPTRTGKDLDFDSYEIFDLDSVVRTVPYEDQADFYGVKSENSASTQTLEDDAWL